jgi:glycosyltransferase involved in cell wall biosynthesis
MRICLIATEIFSHGFYGGFGATTRSLANGLAKKGLETYVIIPRKEGQQPVEAEANFIVLSYQSQAYSGWKTSKGYRHLFKMIDADIYHSEEPSVGTYLAMAGAPAKKHIITFRDPRTLEDRKREWKEAGVSESSLRQKERRMKYTYYRMKKLVKNTDGLFIAAKYAIPKAMKIYGLKTPPRFLPSPVEVPTRHLKKSDSATVCFLGRWDPRKRPEYFFELAKRFGNIKFIAMGGCQPRFADREAELKEKYQSIPNLEMTGWLFGNDKSRILEKSWILINTSWRECLPRSYIEACAHKCAVLSHENPDDFARDFGYWAKEGDMDDFVSGLKYLLEKDRWKGLGQRGFDYVKSTFEYDLVIGEHIKIYEEILKN